jgi:hypothetical protein
MYRFTFFLHSNSNHRDGEVFPIVICGEMEEISKESTMDSLATLEASPCGVRGPGLRSEGAPVVFVLSGQESLALNSGHLCYVG